MTPNATPPRSSKNRIKKRLAALGLGGLLALVVGEVAARALGGSPLVERLPILEVQTHPTRGWSMVPGRHYTYQHAVDVNSFGLRGPEPRDLLPPAERDGVRRVLALGDSLLYGQGVAFEDTLPVLLESRLGAAWGREVEVINGGHRAFATHQSLALLEEFGPELQPDLVVLFWYWNDVDERDVDKVAAHLAENGPVAFDLSWPLEGTRLVKWRAIQLVRRSALVMLTYDFLRAGQGVPWSKKKIETGIEAQRAYLERMRFLCAELGADLELVLMPDAPAVEGRTVGSGITDAFARLASELGFEPIDLFPALVDAAERLGRIPVLPYDGHYDAEGNRVLADAISDALTDEQ